MIPIVPLVKLFVSFMLVFRDLCSHTIYIALSLYIFLSFLSWFNFTVLMMKLLTIRVEIEIFFFLNLFELDLAVSWLNLTNWNLLVVFLDLHSKVWKRNYPVWGWTGTITRELDIFLDCFSMTESWKTIKKDVQFPSDCPCWPWR